MIIKEFRITLPISVEEYQVGQLWSVAEASRKETGGGEGVEVLKNEPYTDVPLLNGKYTAGQYTHKIYHLASKVPSLAKLILPKGALELHEEAWNAFPYCKTVVTNPAYMKENFFIKIESIHLPDAGTTENAHELPPNLLAKREVVHLDISDASALSAGDTKPDTDPTTFKSVVTGRGPFTKGWQNDCTPVMCAYKLVTAEFKWFGLQSRVEKYIGGPSVYPRVFNKFHREVVCWMDKWVQLSMDDIRKLEETTKKQLDEDRRRGSVKGMKPSD
jgi:hypothetical protein